MFCSALRKADISAPVSRWMWVSVRPWTFIACYSPHSLFQAPLSASNKSKKYPKILREIAALRNRCFRSLNLPPTAPHVTSVQNRLSFFAANMSHNSLSEDFFPSWNDLQAVSSLCLNFSPWKWVLYAAILHLQNRIMIIINKWMTITIYTVLNVYTELSCCNLSLVKVFMLFST